MKIAIPNHRNALELASFKIVSLIAKKDILICKLKELKWENDCQIEKVQKFRKLMLNKRNR